MVEALSSTLTKAKDEGLTKYSLHGNAINFHKEGNQFC
uniref:Uncharacterized protein n=1 Tax=Arundo donax TaxID=35708 RepID=A0A0A8Z4Q4_ARUDO